MRWRFGVFITFWLYARGDYKGIFNKNQFHCLTALAFAFVVFWAYVTFSQYFLIWNANVPEETFWYNIREHGDWVVVGMVLLFGHFFLPFLSWLRYKNKVELKPASIISAIVAVIILIDLCYNVLPVLKHHDEPVNFISINLLWVLTSVVGVGGICVWAYLRSFATTKIIPIRDPRIVESLTTTGHRPMSDSPAQFSFPHRTPVFTALIVIVCFAASVWLAKKIYTPHAATIEAVEGVRTPADRKTLLAGAPPEGTGRFHQLRLGRPEGRHRAPADRQGDRTHRSRSRKK